MLNNKNRLIFLFLILCFICGIFGNPILSNDNIDAFSHDKQLAKKSLNELNDLDNDDVDDDDLSNYYLDDDLHDENSLLADSRENKYLVKKSAPRRIFIGKRFLPSRISSDNRALSKMPGRISDIFGKRNGIHRIFIGKRGDIKRIFIGK
ncbi:unnamed protein product [Brachionus calyciflorus]|uniref:Uncharacterized protein n=1 Tax=Brachionus calyciflorus TaxID=104777 RepID=A0A813XJ23_9BILA|nr:unnamed protein product [Brachionus calyciflorus]